MATVTARATGQTATGHACTQNTYLYPGGELVSTAAYDESGAQVRQVACSLGPEDELLSVTGSTEPRSMTYDAAYRTSVLLDGKSQGTHYYYNTAGYLDHVTYPGGAAQQYPLYDSGGRLLKSISPDGVETDFTYNDPESALTDIQYPTSSSLNVHLSYDPYGRLSRVSDGTGSRQFSYDNLDDVLTVQTTYNGLANPLGIGYSYYSNGSISQMVTPAGAFQYSYDKIGRMKALTNPCGRTASWTYQDNGWLSTQALGNGVTSTYTRNQRGFLTDLLTKNGQGQTLSEFSGTGGSMQYDAVGNLLSMTATIPAYTAAAGTTTYQYSSLNELTQEQSGKNGGYTNTFAYDAALNPTTFRGQTQSFNSNNQNTAFTFDSDGNPSSYQGQTASYDVEDRLTGYGGSMTAGYTAAGLRAWKQTSAGKTYYLYDGSAPVCEVNSSGVVTAFNTFGPHGLIGRNTGAGSTLYTFDPLGSVCQRTDSSGNVQSTSQYDAFGNPLGSTSTDPYGYGAQAGYYTDAETGLVLCGHRYYDPSQGRFVTRDPAGYGGGLNLYGYAGDGPVGGVDPLGLSSYWGDVGQVFLGYWDCLNPVTMYQGAVGMAQLYYNCGDEAVGQALIQGFVRGYHDLTTSGDPRTVGRAFFQFELTAAGGAAPFAGGAAAAGAAGAADAAGAGAAGDAAAEAGEAGAAAGGGEAAAGGESITLYRAVNEAEMNDIKASGVFRPGRGSLDFGKWFAEQPEHAAAWGKRFAGWEEGDPLTVVKSELPKSVADAMRREPMLDGIGPARFVETEQFPHFGPITVCGGS